MKILHLGKNVMKSIVVEPFNLAVRVYFRPALPIIVSKVTRLGIWVRTQDQHSVAQNQRKATQYGLHNLWNTSTKLPNSLRRVQPPFVYLFPLTPGVFPENCPNSFKDFECSKYKHCPQSPVDSEAICWFNIGWKFSISMTEYKLVVVGGKSFFNGLNFSCALMMSHFLSRRRR